MNRNRAMKISAFVGGVATAVAGGLTLGPAGAVLAGAAAVAVGLPALFHDVPARKKKQTGVDGGAKGQAVDEESPA